MKYQQLYLRGSLGESNLDRIVDSAEDGTRRRMTAIRDPFTLLQDARVYRPNPLTQIGGRHTAIIPLT